MHNIEVKASSGSYPIYIENGLLSEIGVEVKKIYKGRRIAVVTDSNVDKFYGQKVINSLKESGFEPFKIVVKAGEESKSFGTLLEVDRKSVV